MKSLRLLFIVGLSRVSCHNPVHNVMDSLNPTAQILDMAPKLTTSFDEVQQNDNTRLITLGEAKVDPSKHLTFSPVHQYEEDPEFVTAASQIRQGSALICRAHRPLRRLDHQGQDGADRSGHLPVLRTEYRGW